MAAAWQRRRESNLDLASGENDAIAGRCTSLAAQWILEERGEAAVQEAHYKEEALCSQLE